MNDEHYYCHAEFHRCDGGGPGEALRYNPSLEPLKRWRTIVVDPPWRYRNGVLEHLARHGRLGAACPYPAMTIEDLAALPLADYAERNAHLYLWTTNAFMVEAHDLARAWGFTPTTIITWLKAPGLGLGYYFRNTTEHVVFAVRGSLRLLRADLPTHLVAPRRRHSEKPQAFYDIVEMASPGPYLDVFARKQRFGWDVAGNEVYSAIPELAAKP